MAMDGDESARLREHSARIERLLEEVEGTAGPATWQRVQELMQRVVELYGAGLERVLGHAAQVGAMDAGLGDKLAGDEVVSSLLLVHGLHPLPAPERIQRALDRVRPYLGSHAGGVELIGIGADQVVRLRLIGTCQGCPSSRATIDSAIEGAVREAAPELAGVVVEGAAPSPPVVAGGLVGLRVQPPPAPRWTLVAEANQIPPGANRAIDVSGTRVLFLSVEGALLAYRDACAGCGAALDGSAVSGRILECAACGRRFDVARAGRAVDGGGSLQPVPLLVDGGGARVAVPEAAR